MPLHPTKPMATAARSWMVISLIKTATLAFEAIGNRKPGDNEVTDPLRGSRSAASNFPEGRLTVTGSLV
jgi:hypothetical protein